VHRDHGALHINEIILAQLLARPFLKQTLCHSCRTHTIGELGNWWFGEFNSPIRQLSNFLSPVSLHHIPPVPVVVNPARRYPGGMGAWRTHPHASHPDVSRSVPAVISRNPDHSRTWCDYSGFHDRRRRRHANVDARCGRCCPRAQSRRHDQSADRGSAESKRRHSALLIALDSGRAGQVKAL
jgi:hypothetical protein